METLTPEERQRIYEEERARIEWQRNAMPQPPTSGGYLKSPGPVPPKRGSGLKIVLSILVFFGVVVVGVVILYFAVVVPNLKRSEQSAHETSAIANLKAIGMAETMHSVGAGHGAFTDLRTLAREDDIDFQLGSGQKSGYRFEVEAFRSPDGTPMYDATAVPISSGPLGTGSRSFATNETNVIYEAEGAVELKGTAADRTPPSGKHSMTSRR